VPCAHKVPSVSHPSNRKSQTSLTTCTRETCVPPTEHDAVDGLEASHEPLNILDIPDLAYFGDGRHLIRVHFDAMLGDDVT
jgi:hypothetical protein